MAESGDPLRIAYLEAVDGLTVARQAPPPRAGSFSATYVAPAGWAFDEPGAEGTARLAAHLAAVAAGPFDRVELARRLDRLGATLTSQCAPESAELTVWGPADAWATLLGLLAEAVARPRFAPEDVARARRQLLERQLQEATQPASRADREFLRAVFPERHPYRGTGVGSRRSLGRLSRARLLRFHRRQFLARGGVVVLTTAARGPAVVREARRRFGTMPKGAEPTLPSTARAAGPAARRTIDLPGRSQVEVRIGGAGLARADPRYPAAYLANEVLGGRPLLSRLFQRVRERGGLAYRAHSDLEAMRWGGYWVASAGTGADRWRKVVPMLSEELARLREEEVPARELRLVRESAIGEIPLSLEVTSDAHELAVDAAYHRLAEDHWRRWPHLLRALRPRDLREVAAAAFGPAGPVTVVAGPLDPRR